MKCPHCKAEFVDCGKGQHCNGCGCCFQADGKTLRPGHPACRGHEESFVPAGVSASEPEEGE